MGLFRKHTSYQTNEPMVAEYEYQPVEAVPMETSVQPTGQPVAYEMAQAEVVPQPVEAKPAAPRLIVDVIAPWDIARPTQQLPPAQTLLSVEQPIAADSPMPVAIEAMPAY